MRRKNRTFVSKKSDNIVHWRSEFNTRDFYDLVDDEYPHELNFEKNHG